MIKILCDFCEQDTNGFQFISRNIIGFPVGTIGRSTRTVSVITSCVGCLNSEQLAVIPPQVLTKARASVSVKS